MKKFKNFLPIEFYFLLIPAVFLFLLSIIYLRSFSINAISVKDFLQTSFGPASPFGTFFLMLFLIVGVFGMLILFFTNFFWIISLCKERKTISQIQEKINWGKIILSLFSIILLLSLVMYSLGLFTSLLFQVASPARTAEFGKVFLSWDKAIFKTDPGVWMINKFSGTFIEKVLLWTYNSIYLMLSLVLLLSFLFNKNAFRRLILSFFVSWIIAFPIWFLFPTLPPDLMFRLNKLNTAGLEEVKAFNNFNPSPLLKQNLKFQEDVHIVNVSQAKRNLPTSTFPSMHAAWGVVIAYAGVVLSPLLGIFLVPWAILNGFGAVYILEHFSVDIFLGFIIAIISIIITETLLRFESKYFEDKFGLLSGFDCLRLIIKRFLDQTGLYEFFKKIKER